MLVELYNIWSEFDRVPHILVLSGGDVSIGSGVPYMPIETSILKKEYKEKMLGLDNPFSQDSLAKNLEKRAERFKGKSKMRELMDTLSVVDDSCNFLYITKEGTERVYNSLESITFWGLDSYQKYLNNETLIHHPPELWNWIFDKREKLLFLEANNIHYNFLKMQDELSHYLNFGTSAIDGLMDRSGIQNLVEFNGNILKNKRLSKEESLQVKDHSAVIFKDIHNNLIRPDLLLLNEKLDVQKIITLHLLKIQTDIVIIIGGGKDTAVLWKYIENMKKYKKIFVIEFNEYDSNILSDLSITLPLSEAIDTFSSLVIELEKNHIKKYT